MFKLIKQLFSTREGSRTVVIVDDNGTKPSSSHRLNAVNLWMALIGVIVAIIFVVVILLRFTPMGGLVYDQEEIRNSVIAIQQRVATLQDTLEARNVQLNKMQNIIRTGGDTTFESSVTPIPEGNDSNQVTAQAVPLQQFKVQRLPADAVLISNLFSQSPDFPAPFPLEGTSTRTYNIENGHYGLDIAASSDAMFKVIADGVILSQEWTFNFGYVVTVQHANGIISIYKHGRRVDKAIGETVRAGDILGTIGDVGMLSSGPHLHIEIWKKGIPQNPLNYLIKP